MSEAAAAPPSSRMTVDVPWTGTFVLLVVLLASLPAIVDVFGRFFGWGQSHASKDSPRERRRGGGGDDDENEKGRGRDDSPSGTREGPERTAETETMRSGEDDEKTTTSVVRNRTGVGARGDGGGRRPSERATGASVDPREDGSERASKESSGDVRAVATSTPPMRGIDDGAKDDSAPTNEWRCACKGGFLPPGLLKSFGGAEAVLRMSTGQCYHKY